VGCDAFRKESAVPEEASSAFKVAELQSNHKIPKYHPRGYISVCKPTLPVNIWPIPLEKLVKGDDRKLSLVEIFNC